MKGIIMAGGFGTRLRPLTINTPKPMVPIGGLPLMEHVVSLLVRHKLTDITSLLYFQPDKIRDHFAGGQVFGAKMDYCLPKDDLGTAGAVRYALGDCNETVLVISGDVVTDFDLQNAIKWHKSKKADATILLTRIENPVAFGVVITNEDGKIVRFLEKPSWGEAFSDTINTGIYILEQSAVDLIPKNKPFDFSQDLYPEMLKRGMGLYGKVIDGYWKDVGNVGEYVKVHDDLFCDHLKLYFKRPVEKLCKGILRQGNNVHLADDIEISGCVILGDDVQVAMGTHLHNCSIGHRCYIGSGCEISNTVIWDDCQLGNENRLAGAIVCARSSLGANVQLFESSIVSDDCVIGDSATIKANCKLWPGKTVDEGATVSSSLVWGDKWNRELFTDSKVTGLALTEITPEMAVKLGAAFGASLGQGASVVSSRDDSNTSRLLRRSLTSGLLAAGVNVSDLETLPVPVVRYALGNGDYDAGIFVRHNPADYKRLDLIFFHGSSLDMPTSHLKKVERNYFGEDFQRAGIDSIGRLENPQHILENYQSDFIGDINVELIQKAGFKVIIDYSYGASSQLFPDIFNKLGISATELNANPKQKHFSISPEEEASAIVQLSAIVRSLQADIGFRINPAAEKLTVIDETGRPLDNQTLLLLVTELFLETNGPCNIAVPVAASMGVEEIAERYGAEVLRVGSDHQAMMEVHRSGRVSFVGGTRGGFIFPGFQTGSDAILSAVKILQMFAQTNSRFGLRAEKFDHLVRRTVSVPCPWSRKGTVMRMLIADSNNKQRELIDGVRIFEDDGWVLVVPDRFKSSFNIMAEARTPAKADQLVGDYSKLVKKSQEN